MIFGMEIFFRILPGLFYHKIFRIDMTISLWSANLYLSTVGWQQSIGEFALLFSSGGNPINGSYKLLTPSKGDLSSGVGFTIVSEWGYSHQQSGELDRALRGGGPSSNRESEWGMLDLIIIQNKIHA